MFKKYWFKPKKYGYGATPTTWEGWLLVLLLIFVIFFLSLAIEKSIYFIISFLLVISIFLIISKTKTRGMWKWRWGK